MKFDCISSDPVSRDKNYSSGVINLLLHQGNDRLHGLMYTPSGKGPHPTIVLLHGFPGYEQNLDLAQTLRRGGFNVATFHYRGSWGSEGDFSFSNVLEDTELAIKFLSSDHAVDNLGIDKDRMIIAGHSMGGFAALAVSPLFKHIRHIISIAPYNLGKVGKEFTTDERFRDKTREMFEECIVPLKGTGIYDLIEEIKTHKNSWDLSEKGSVYGDRKILLVGGSLDSVCERNIHHDPLANAIRNYSAAFLSEKLLEDGHSFHDSRIALSEIILQWLCESGFEIR